MATNAELIARLYIGYYDRAPDPVGLQYWVGRLEAGVPLVDIANSFAASPEAKATYPYFLLPSALNAQDFLEQVYMNVFGRAIDTGPGSGLEYYGDMLANGVSAGEVLLKILQNAASNATPGNTDAEFLQNKVDVGLYWAGEAAANLDQVYEADGVTLQADAAVSAAGVIDGVSANDDSVVEGQTETDEFFNTGSNFALTNGVDLGAVPGEPFYGTEKNDTYVAGPGPSAGISKNTLGAGDVLDGAGGVDKLLIVDDAASALVPNISNIEQVIVQAVGPGDTTVNAVNATGVEEVWLQNSTQDLDINNLKENPLFGFESNIGGGQHTIDANFVAGTLGNNATIALAVKNDANAEFDATVGGGDVIKTLAVTAEGKGNVLDAQGGALNAVTSVTIDGAGDLAIDIDQAGLTNFDASKNSGGITVTLTGAGTDLTTKGSSGDDVFTYRDIRAADTTDGGDGADRIIVTGQDISAAGNPLLGGLNKMTAIETIEFDGNDFVKVDHKTFSNADVTKFLINTNGNANEIDQIDNAISEVVYAFGDDNDDGAIINMKAGVTTANLAFENRTGGDDAHVTDNLVVKGASIINIASIDETNGATTENHVQRLINDKGATINVTGDAAFEIAQLGAGATVNGASMTKSLQVLGGSADSDTLIGGSADDILTGDSAVSVLVPGVPQVTTFSIANAEAGDVFTVGGQKVVWTNVDATNNTNVKAALAAAITGEGSVGNDTNASATAGTWTVTGAADGSSFAVPVTNASNGAGIGDKVTFTLTGDFDPSENLIFALNGNPYSVNVANQTLATASNTLATFLNNLPGLTATVSVAGTIVVVGPAGEDLVFSGLEVNKVANDPPGGGDNETVAIADVETYTFSGTTIPGVANVTVNGVLLTVTGQVTNNDSADNLANLINANATLQGLGISATATGATPTVTITSVTGLEIAVTSTTSGISLSGPTTVTNGLKVTNNSFTQSDPSDPIVAPGVTDTQSFTSTTTTVAVPQVTIGGINADTYTGGAGADLFKVATSAATAAAADVITDFNGVDGDTIDFSSFGAATSTNYSEGPLSGFGSFNDALTQANSEFAAGGGNLLYSAQQVGADVYVFADAGQNGDANEVIQLVGVTLADVDFSHIV